jgi:hypothetical protein
MAATSRVSGLIRTKVPISRVLPSGAVPLVLGLTAILLAGAGEAVIRSGNASGLGLGLYLVGIVFFSFGAWPTPTASGALPAGGGVSRRARPLAVGIIAALLAAGACWSALETERFGGAAWLWAASALALLIGAVFSGRALDVPERWAAATWPSSWKMRIVLVLALGAVAALALATRLPRLDRVPFGINADEGDQAAVALGLLKGSNDSSVFGVGWYHLSMVYFKLLAFVMGFAGQTHAGARVLGAVSGVLTVGLVTTAVSRHFGWRAGLLAGGLLSSLGVALQFSRETTVAGPTATLWALSAALFLEAARTNRAWAWAGAGLSGAFSLYFYPTGRLWPVLAVLFCVSLLVRAPRGTRTRVATGVAAAAIGALVVAGPFFQRLLRHPDEFAVRARETTVFRDVNARRLSYYREGWSVPRLLGAQIERSIGIFNRYSDQNAFWPTDRPILPPALAALTLLGLGTAVLRARDPRLLLLFSWFLAGFVGVVVTVETPNLHRMSTAVPLIAVFAALVLDDLARRVEAAGRIGSGVASRVAGGAATAGVALAAGILMAGELRFYFQSYAATDRWVATRLEGKAVSDRGPSWVFSLGSHVHMIHSGWIRLLAPLAYRGGLLSPGHGLPLSLPPNRGLAFLLYPLHRPYLPYLEEFYPGGATIEERDESGNVLVSVFDIPREVWRTTTGALAFPPSGGAPARVAAPGEAPAGWSRFPSPMRWTFGLRARRYGNYSFRVGPGPARLSVDGREVMRVAPGAPDGTATLSLPAGEHGLSYAGTLTRFGASALFEWKTPDEEADLGASFRKPPPSLLRATDGRSQGLLCVVTSSGHPELRRLDGGVATGGLASELRREGELAATWTGTLTAPADGMYAVSFFSIGGSALELKVDGRSVLRFEGDGANSRSDEIFLTAGPHAVEIRYGTVGPPGALEWSWTPPGGRPSIVPPSVLVPPPAAGPGAPLPPPLVEALGREEPPLSIVLEH